MNARTIAWCASLAALCGAPAGAQQVHHYVFFGQDRARIHQDSAFLATAAFEGAQVVYPWQLLEPEKDRYDFSAVREDLAFLRSRGKRLFIQLQDASFSASRTNVPAYLLREGQYRGGAARQYRMEDGDETRAVVEGWTSRRWDPAVQERLHKLFAALGAEFDGRIEGINLPETAVGLVERGRLAPEGFSFEGYRDAVVTNMKSLKRAFPRSVALQYVNFMPGEWRPTEDKGYLRAVYDAAKASNVAVGGPDLLPYRRGQLKSSYPLIRDAAEVVPVGIAVQDGNFEDLNPKTGKRATIAELLAFATDYLKADYIFWGTQEPYYSAEVVPMVRALR